MKWSVKQANERVFLSDSNLHVQEVGFTIKQQCVILTYRQILETFSAALLLETALSSVQCVLPNPKPYPYPNSNKI